MCGKLAPGTRRLQPSRDDRLLASFFSAGSFVFRAPPGSAQASDGTLESPTEAPASSELLAGSLQASLDCKWFSGDCAVVVIVVASRSSRRQRVWPHLAPNTNNDRSSNNKEAAAPQIGSELNEVAQSYRASGATSALGPAPEQAGPRASRLNLSAGVSSSARVALRLSSRALSSSSWPSLLLLLLLLFRRAGRGWELVAGARLFWFVSRVATGAGGLALAGFAFKLAASNGAPSVTSDSGPETWAQVILRARSQN